MNLKQLLFLKAAVPSEPVEKTVVGNPVSFKTKYAEPMKLVIPFAPVQPGTGNPSPENVRPISGFDSAAISVTGKNLLYNRIPGRTASNIAFSSEDGVVSVSGQASATAWLVSNASVTSSMVQLYKAGTYTMSGTVMGVRLMFMEWVNGASTSVAQCEDGGTVTFTLESDTLAWVQVRIASGTNFTTKTAINAQIEKGSNATEYNAPEQTVKTVTFPDTTYGGTLTVNADGTGELVVDTAFYEFDGSEDESWNISTSATNKYKLGSIVVTAYNADERMNAIGSSLPCVSITLAGSEIGFGLSANNQIRIRYGLFETLTVSELKTYLSQNPLQVAYKINNPQTVSLSPGLVKSIIGQNNVWTDTNGENTVTYIK